MIPVARIVSSPHPPLIIFRCLTALYLLLHLDACGFFPPGKDADIFAPSEESPGLIVASLLVRHLESWYSRNSLQAIICQKVIRNKILMKFMHFSALYPIFTLTSVVCTFGLKSIDSFKILLTDSLCGCKHYRVRLKGGG